ncbi:ABC transporter, transmembrane region [Actinosynnema pretiosum subsp. pretiosum]|nr:ABC transporter, transmembrane region [Actinosynnema pretiosum subsp. pretiosum]
MTAPAAERTPTGERPDPPPPPQDEPDDPRLAAAALSELRRPVAGRTRLAVALAAVGALARHARPPAAPRGAARPGCPPR